jgi:hypothetical protein
VFLHSSSIANSVVHDKELTSKLTKGREEKKRQRKSDEGEEDMPAGGLMPGAQVSDASDPEYDFCALVQLRVFLTRGVVVC